MSLEKKKKKKKKKNNYESFFLVQASEFIEEVFNLKINKEVSEEDKPIMEIEYIDLKEPMFEIVRYGALKNLDKDIKQELGKIALNAFLFALNERFEVRFIKVTEEEISKRADAKKKDFQNES